MMCSIGLATGACLGEPIEQSASLSDLSTTRIVYHRSAESLQVWLEYSWNEQGACAVLGADFEGRVNDVPMQVTRRGSAMDDDGDECEVPSLVLKDPPAASHTVITLRDRSRAITCDLGDVLAPRTIKLLPDGPWELSPGQEVTVQWLPVTDLEKEPMIWVNDQYRKPAVGQNLVTFTMPENPTTPDGEIKFWAHSSSCPGGLKYGGWPVYVTQPFKYRTGSALLSEARTDAAPAL